MQYTTLVLAIVVGLFALACGDTEQRSGPECTDQELAIPAEDCTVPADEFGAYDIDKGADLVKFCKSPCNRMHGIELRDLDGLTDMTPFSRIEVIEGTLVLEDNENLESLDGLENLTQAGGIQINSNGNLATIEALSSLQSSPVDGEQMSISISYEKSLETLAGLESVQAMEKLTLEDNPNLSDISYFDSLETLDRVKIVRNPKLPACQIDQLAQQVESEPQREVYGNGEGACE